MNRIVGVSAKSAGQDTWTDIFSSDLNWDPKLGKEPENMMNKIVVEIQSWLHLENFSFPALPRYHADSILDVPSVTSLLSLVLRFLECVEASENNLVHKLLSASVQSEHTRKKYIWWVLSNTGGGRGLMDFAEKLLGRRLHQCLANYCGSRKALFISVSQKLDRIKTWAGAYSNGEASVVLEAVFRELCKVHQNFRAWQAAVSVAVIRKGWDKNSSRLLTLEEVQKELESLEMKMKQPSASPNIDPADFPRKQDCSRECIMNTEYLHFSRGQSLQHPRIMKVAVPVCNSQYQRLPAASDADSGLSGSPPSQVSSSWPESEVFGYALEASVPQAGAYDSRGNFGALSRPAVSPVSVVSANLAQAIADVWGDDHEATSNSISENDTEDLSEVFLKFMSIHQSQPSWTSPIQGAGRCRATSGLPVEELDSTLQGLKDVIPGEAGPQFWQNIFNLASISGRAE